MLGRNICASRIRFLIQHLLEDDVCHNPLKPKTKPHYARTQAWGVCHDKVKLPSSGFDYEVQTLARIRSMPLAPLFREYTECGTTPLVVRFNEAGRYGGGLFKQVYIHVCET